MTMHSWKSLEEASRQLIIKLENIDNMTDEQLEAFDEQLEARRAGKPPPDPF